MISKKPLKERRCAVCREPYIPKRIGLKITKVCLNAGCVLDYAQGLKAKEIKKQERANAVAKKEYYRQDLAWQHKQCQPVFNKLRRLQELKWFHDRGLTPACISCGNPLGGDVWCNGHFKSVGSSSSLRYDFRNSYLQHNFRCNSALSGDINGTAKTHGYKQGLINRFGEEVGQSIIDYCESKAAEVSRFTWQELEEMRKEWNKQIRELENASKTMQ